MPIENDLSQEIAGDSAAIRAMKARLSRFDTSDGRRRGLVELRLRPTDVLIVTTPKAGTTWMQQIVHQLRTGGDDDFDEISRVVPWLELAHDIGMDLDAEQRGVFRAFKTHACVEHAPPGARYIVVVRDYVDVCASFYRFFSGWFFEEGEVSPDEFARAFFLRRDAPASMDENAGYFHHVAGWYGRRDDDDVLWLHYEDMKDDLRGVVERVAAFLGVDDARAIEEAVRRSSFGYMKANEHLFDDKLTKLGRNEIMGLPRDAGMSSTKVRVGRVGSGHQTFSDEVVREMDAKWRAVVTPVTGAATYAELRARCGLAAQG